MTRQAELKDKKGTEAPSEPILLRQHTSEMFSGFRVVKADDVKTERPREESLVGDFVLVKSNGKKPVSSEVLFRNLDKDSNVLTVNTGYMNGSSGIILCPGITKCQAIVFWDPLLHQAVIAHKNQATEPRDMLKGNATYLGMYRQSQDIDNLLPKSQKDSVQMVHVCIATWDPHSWIEKAVSERGFHNPIPMLKAEAGHIHVAIDAQSGLLAIMSPSWKLPILKQLPVLTS